MQRVLEREEDFSKKSFLGRATLKPARAKMVGMGVEVSFFWEMFAAYEEATILEAKALNSREIEQLESLGDRKAQLLKQMQDLGARLGLDRSNDLLRERLNALQEAERMNLEALSTLLARMRTAGEEVEISRRKLSSVRGVYASGTEVSEFLGEG